MRWGVSFVLVCLGLFGASQVFRAFAAEEKKPSLELTVYTYDSLTAPGALGAEIFPAFENKCGCRLKILPSGDGGQLLTRLQIDAERHKPQAQIVLGLDEAVYEQAKPYLEEWKGWTPGGFSELDPGLRKKPGFLPFDFGFFAFIADREGLARAKLGVPSKLTDLLDSRWKRNVILEDPRTSTPGLAFVLYADAVVGASSIADFWSRMRTQWLTLSAGWDGAYSLFLRKEAPLVWSYTTSQAYHEEHGDSAKDRRYQAVILADGAPMQVEGAALVKGSFLEGEQGKKQRRLAQDFLEYLLSSPVQAQIPRHQWMYPARKGVTLPESFRNVPRPAKIIHLETRAAETAAALSRWSRAVQGWAAPQAVSAAPSPNTSETSSKTPAPGK